MTNREAVKSLIGFDIPDSVLDARATLSGLTLDDEYQAKRIKVIVRFSASLMLYVAQTPSSIREIDWQITNRSVEELLLLRKAMLAENGVEDTFGKPKVKNRQWVG